MKKIFDCLRKNPYTSFVYETIQFSQYQLVSLIAENPIFYDHQSFNGQDLRLMH